MTSWGGAALGSNWDSRQGHLGTSEGYTDYGHLHRFSGGLCDWQASYALLPAGSADAADAG